MIDSASGKVYDNQFGSMNLYQITAVNPTTGQITINPFTSRGGKNWERFNEMESTWRLKFGVKYRFLNVYCDSTNDVTKCKNASCKTGIFLPH
ncbi:hypothetical protein [Alishewanella longhuensis]